MLVSFCASLNTELFIFIKLVIWCLCVHVHTCVCMCGCVCGSLCACVMFVCDVCVHVWCAYMYTHVPILIL